MADYWIKWYHEILDDPKMATLPDRLWRRFSELCLLAGKLCPSKSGNLPDTRQIAWMLRMQTDDLQTDLEQLVSVGLIESIPNGWFIVNFKKRQSPATSTERVKQYRERKQKGRYYEDETDLKRKVTQINRLTETELDTETDTNNQRPDEEPELVLYREVTGLVPDFSHVEEVKRNVRAIQERKHIPIDMVRELMKTKFAEWCATKTPEGKPYNPSNPKWLEWCVTGYSPKPEKPANGKRPGLRGI